MRKKEKRNWAKILFVLVGLLVILSLVVGDLFAILAVAPQP